MAFVSSLRFAIRSIAARPLFVGVVVVSLGLAIGGNSAVFSLVDAALLRPLDVREPDRLINVYTTDSGGRGYQTSSYPDYAVLRDELRGVSGVFAHSGLMTTITGGKPEVIFGEIVTGNYFAVSGARIALGRAFTPDEDRVPGANPVVVISDRLWHRRFGGDSVIVGRTITLNGHPFTVVGVAAPEFSGMLFRGVNSDLWAPTMMMGALRTDQLRNREERWMFVKARLAPGASIGSVARSLATIGARLSSEYPASNAGRTFVARATNDVMVNPDGDRFILPGAAMVLAAVGLIVLIAAANIANLMFARAAARSREIAVRLALGASRGQLVTMLLAESGLLAALGGALGLGLAFLFARLVVAFQPPIPLPISFDVGVDARVVAFTLLMTTLAAVLFGLVPALHATRPSLTHALSGARVGVGHRSALLRLRGLFLVPQLTLSLVLLVIAGLFARSVAQAAKVDAGFDVERTAMIALSLNLDGYDSARAAAFYADLTSRLASRPAVQSLAVTDRIPLDLYGNRSEEITVLDAAVGTTAARVVQSANVDAGYFETLGIRLAAGRAFTAAEVRDGAPVTVVSEATARRFWPNASGIGRTIRGADGRTLEVIGVARDAKVQTLGESPVTFVYHPLAPRYAQLLRIVARTSSSGDRLVATLRAEVAALDPGVAVFESGTMHDHVGLMLFPYRAAAAVSALLGAFGLLLSSVGLFGVVAFSVARRTRELGIRIAIGAAPREVVRMVVGEQLRVVAVSMALGLALSLAVARALGSVVFGIAWADPVTFAAVTAVLSVMVMLASAIPAARAGRISPATALREE
jgi:predicted permease